MLSFLPAADEWATRLPRDEVVAAINCAHSKHTIASHEMVFSKCGTPQLHPMSARRLVLSKRAPWICDIIDHSFFATLSLASSNCLPAVLSRSRLRADVALLSWIWTSSCMQNCTKKPNPNCLDNPQLPANVCWYRSKCAIFDNSMWLQS